MALSTTKSEYISTKDVAHALEIRNDLAECDMTLKMKGITDVTAGRATAARRGVGRVHHLDARLSWLQQLCAEGVMESRFRRTQRGRPGVEDDRFDFAFERNTPSTANEFIELELTDGGSKFPRDEAAKDCCVSIWNVRNVCETIGWFWICVGMVIVILTVLSGVPSGISISDDCSQQRETDKNAAWQLEHHAGSKIRTTAWNPDGAGVICRSEKPADAGGKGVACGHKSCKCCW